MDETPSRRVTFAVQVEETSTETLTDNEVLINDHHNSNSEVTAGMEDGNSNNGDVEMNNGADKMKIKSFHRKVCDTVAKRFPELCFVSVQDFSGNSMIVITQQTLNHHPPFGHVSRIHAIILVFQYEVHVMMRKLESGVFESVANVQELCNKFTAQYNYKFCPGIDPKHYKLQYYEAIRFDIKSV